MDADTPVATTQQQSNSRTLPKCVRCRNHNEVSLLSGHKRFCRYRRCVCHECLRTVRRQKKMARQIAKRRRKKLEDERSERGEPVPAATPSPSTSSTSSTDTTEHTPSIQSRWLPYPDRNERTRGTYEANVSSSSSGISSSNSTSLGAAYAGSSCRSPAGSDISVTALSDNDHWPSDQRLRLAELASAPTHSAAGDPMPVDLEAVDRLASMLRSHAVDTDTLLYVILSIVSPDVDIAYSRIRTAQEEMRSLKSALPPSPPLTAITRPSDSSSSISPTPPSLYRSLQGHPPPPAPAPPPPLLVPRALHYPAHLPFFVPIPARIPLGISPTYSYLSGSEEPGFQYRPANLRATSLSLTNVEEISSTLRNNL